jgi:hypothetical protein
MPTGYGRHQVARPTAERNGLSTHRGHSRFAIACDAPHPFETITLTLGEGNTFYSNNAGDIDPNCPAP